MKTLLAIIIILVSSISYAAPLDKITICHATSSKTNPWVEITISLNAWQTGHTPHAVHVNDFVVEGNKTCPPIEPPPPCKDCPPPPPPPCKDCPPPPPECKDITNYRVIPCQIGYEGSRTQYQDCLCPDLICGEWKTSTDTCTKIKECPTDLTHVCVYTRTNMEEITWPSMIDDIQQCPIIDGFEVECREIPCVCK